MTCADAFSTPLLGHLMNLGERPLLNNQAQAETLATSSQQSSSSLTLRVQNLIGPSEDDNSVSGRVEYSASTCGEATCPFYLGNLTLHNSTDIWDLYSDDQGDFDVSNLDVGLRRPVFGVWRPSTGEVYIAANMIDFSVSMDLTNEIGNTASIRRAATNDSALYGQISLAGELTFTGLTASTEGLEAVADLDYDSLDGSAPAAWLSLDTYVRAGPSGGFPLTDIDNQSSDPDGDLDYSQWIVDGVWVDSSYVLPLGAHTIRFLAMDSRQAMDVHERSVTVVQ